MAKKIAAKNSAKGSGQNGVFMAAENQIKIAGAPVFVTPEAQEAEGGGEIHQFAGATHPSMTNNRGTVVSDDENSLKAGARGPVLTEDFFLVEKTQHFDHERIPERIVHARGYGAHGYFELTDSLEGVTKAKVLTTVGQQNACFRALFHRRRPTWVPATWLGMFVVLLSRCIPRRVTGTS